MRRPARQPQRAPACVGRGPSLPPTPPSIADTSRRTGTSVEAAAGRRCCLRAAFAAQNAASWPCASSALLPQAPCSRHSHGHGPIIGGIILKCADYHGQLTCEADSGSGSAAARASTNATGIQEPRRCSPSKRHREQGATRGRGHRSRHTLTHERRGSRRTAPVRNSRGARRSAPLPGTRRRAAPANAQCTALLAAVPQQPWPACRIPCAAVRAPAARGAWRRCGLQARCLQAAPRPK